MSALNYVAPAAQLTRHSWEDCWDEVSQHTFDVVVVGAGITGAGTALDAAKRGLSTLLVDQSDIACGTSRWSSKMAHGGLRYLATGQLGVAHESAVERGNLLTYIAPHLAFPSPFIMPLDHQTTPLLGLAGRIGASVGDVLRMLAGTSSRILPGPRHINAREAATWAPALDFNQLRGATLYWDGKLTDDARLVVAVVRTAAALGALVMTYANASNLDETGLTLTNRFTGESVRLRSRTVINATGVWAGELEPQVSITPSRGTHLVVEARALDYPRAVWSAPVPGELARFVFATPIEDDLVLIGLTDEAAVGEDPECPRVPPEDIDFLLNTISAGLKNPLTRSDVRGCFAGLRPLVTSDATNTADISRRHLLIDEPGRPITITGGKLTAYRQMAEDAVDAACKRLGSKVSCTTHTMPLLGAASRKTLRNLAFPKRLIRRYGTEAAVICRLAEEFPDLAGPVCSQSQITGVELLFGVLAEGALTVEDLVSRRTRLSLISEWAKEAEPVARKVFEVAGVEPLERTA